MTRNRTATPLDHLCALQHEDGRWEAEMVWNSGLLAQYVISCRVAGPWPMPDSDVRAARRYFEVTRLPDGSWPVHSEGGSSVTGTVLAYVALRLLGVGPDDAIAGSARDWLRRDPDRVLHMPTSARIWLAVVGLYEYEGIVPALPELLTAPRWFPLHPARFACHLRQVYVGMAWLYGMRARFDLDVLTGQLRAELYDRPYRTLDFRSARFRLAAPEVCAPPRFLARLAQRVFSWYDRRPIAALRQAGLRRCAEFADADAEASAGMALSVVQGLLAHLGRAASGRPAAELHARFRAFDRWRWLDDDEGLRIVGARSSSWDTAFALRACASTETTPASRAAVARAHTWLAGQQISRELPEQARTGRDPAVGGWCFSEAAHGWPVADCTAEALSALLVIREHPELSAVTEPVPLRAQVRAVDFILSRQNRDGGFGTYERARAPEVLEHLNMAEMFVNCVTDHSYVECTGSCIAALARFRRAHPGQRRALVDRAIRGGVEYLRKQQRSDGSYPAGWGIAFTYGTFFAVEGLVTAGVSTSDPAVARAVAWLLSVQLPGGGWGEHHSSVLSGEYTALPHAHAVMTAWAVLALLAGGLPEEHPAVRKGRDVLLALRAAHLGPGWPQQACSGIFYGSAVLDYRLYKGVFPVWALGSHSVERGE
ncbi:hypothetical protein [Lentzea sp. E54]|uniref:hypothetical protein n=1 Tax=Lentzea xerophila TaxID=3435883 RepID=UPI003DA644FD